jgi:hypothetical protein
MNDDAFWLLTPGFCLLPSAFCLLAKLLPKAHSTSSIVWYTIERARCSRVLSAERAEPTATECV